MRGPLLTRIIDLGATFIKVYSKVNMPQVLEIVHFFKNVANKSN